VASASFRAEGQNVLTDLIEPIVSDARAPDSEGVRQRIRDPLAAHGDRKELPQKSQSKCLDALCAKAWNVTTKEKGRALTLVDFIRLFDRATRIFLPISGYGATPRPTHP